MSRWLYPVSSFDALNKLLKYEHTGSELRQQLLRFVLGHCPIFQQQDSARRHQASVGAGPAVGRCAVQPQRQPSRIYQDLWSRDRRSSENVCIGPSMHTSSEHFYGFLHTK